MDLFDRRDRTRGVVFIFLISILLYQVLYAVLGKIWSAIFYRHTRITGVLREHKHYTVITK